MSSRAQRRIDRCESYLKRRYIDYERFKLDNSPEFAPRQWSNSYDIACLELSNCDINKLSIRECMDPVLYLCLVFKSLPCEFFIDSCWRSWSESVVALEDFAPRLDEPPFNAVRLPDGSVYSFAYRYTLSGGENTCGFLFSRDNFVPPEIVTGPINYTEDSSYKPPVVSTALCSPIRSSKIDNLVSSTKGGAYEQLVADAVCTFPGLKVETTANWRGGAGDLIVTSDLVGKIIIEVKNYTRPVNGKEVEKLHRDVRLQRAEGAILISRNSIAGIHRPIHKEEIPGAPGTGVCPVHMYALNKIPGPQSESEMLRVVCYVAITSMVDQLQGMKIERSQKVLDSNSGEIIRVATESILDNSELFQREIQSLSSTLLDKFKLSSEILALIRREGRTISDEMNGDSYAPVQDWEEVLNLYPKMCNPHEVKSLFCSINTSGEKWEVSKKGSTFVQIEAKNENEHVLTFRLEKSKSKLFAPYCVFEPVVHNLLSDDVLSEFVEIKHQRVGVFVNEFTVDVLINTM